MTPDEVMAWAGYAVTSPLYTELCHVIARDERLLDVLAEIEHTPPLNILFAGVQYLMARDGGSDLAAHYPNFNPESTVEGVGLPFTEFVLANRDSLIQLGRTRYTQTNEPRRCVALLPVVWASGVTRFHLVDVGTSAGLNLLLDRYRYRWGEIEWGPPSPVVLNTEMRSGRVEPGEIEVLSRTGIDLNPIDPNDADQRAWLEALVWPEHHERRARLRSALSVAAENTVDLVAGSALEELGKLVSSFPGEEPVVVLHSFVLNQMTTEQRSEFALIVDRLRRHRTVVVVGMEAMDSSRPWAELTLDVGSGPVTVGQAHHHGEWLEL